MNFSWVDMNLAASAYPKDRENLEFLIEQHHIDIIINLTENSYLNPFPNKLIVRQYKIQNYGIPEDDIKQLIHYIDDEIKHGKNILIHCEGGCGRTGLVVALYQSQKYPNRDRTQIISNLRRLRPCSIETEEQYQYVLNFSFP